MPTPPAALADLDDDELAAHLNDVLAEGERRRRLATVPAQIASLTAQYVADGGDKTTIVAAIA